MILNKKFLQIFNLSKKRSDLGRLHSVVEFGWPEELAPPLDRLCSICKLLENWLSANAQNVVVIHCKGGCSRAAIVIAAYMHYISICSKLVNFIQICTNNGSNSLNKKKVLISILKFPITIV